MKRQRRHQRIDQNLLFRRAEQGQILLVDPFQTLARACQIGLVTTHYKIFIC